jgi:orotate phosphoribosyltransferase-like protein
MPKSELIDFSKASDLAKDIDTHEKFIELRARGHSYQHISEQLKVSKPTLIKWAHFHEVEIKNLRAMHLDSVWQEAKLCAEARIANLSASMTSRIL